MKTCSANSDNCCYFAASKAYSRIEVLCILATVAALLFVTLPAVGHGVPKSRALACQANMKRLSLAWVLYANDNRDRFPQNYHGGFIPSATSKEKPWAVGWLDWQTSPDNTNIQYLITPRYASLGEYIQQDASVFKCPADVYLSRVQQAKRFSQRVRSVSMSIYVGEGNAETGPIDRAFVHARQAGDLLRPGPANTYVITEEHADTINDPAFFTPLIANWVSLPASYHEGAGHISFADGHVVLQRWRNTSTVQSVKFTDRSNMPATSDDLDVEWLRERTPK